MRCSKGVLFLCTLVLFLTCDLASAVRKKQTSAPGQRLLFEGDCDTVLRTPRRRTKRLFIHHGIQGLVLEAKTQREENEKLRDFISLSRNWIDKLIKHKLIALALHIDNPKRKNPHVFWIFNLGALNDNHFQGQLLEGCQRLPDDLRKYVLDNYRELGMDEDNIEKLRKVSIQTQDRTFVVVSTVESFVQKQEDGVFVPVNEIQHFTFNSGASVVYSSSQDEPLPVELFIDGFQVDRSTRGKIVEIGRYVISKKPVELRDRELSPRMVFALSNMIQGIGDVRSIVIEADEARKAIFQPYGFEDVKRRQAPYRMRRSPRGRQRPTMEYVLIGDAPEVGNATRVGLIASELTQLTLFDVMGVPPAKR